MLKLADYGSATRDSTADSARGLLLRQLPNHHRVLGSSERASVINASALNFHSFTRPPAVPGAEPAQGFDFITEKLFKNSIHFCVLTHWSRTFAER
jgi:hypothetical protein